MLRIANSDVTPTVLILPAGHDELVPEARGTELEHVCDISKVDVRHLAVKAFLHHEVLSKPEGRQAVVSVLTSIAEKG